MAGPAPGVVGRRRRTRSQLAGRTTGTCLAALGADLSGCVSTGPWQGVCAPCRGSGRPGGTVRRGCQCGSGSGGLHSAAGCGWWCSTLLLIRSGPAAWASPAAEMARTWGSCLGRPAWGPGRVGAPALGRRWWARSRWCPQVVEVISLRVQWLMVVVGTMLICQEDRSQRPWAWRRGSPLGDGRR